MNRIAVHATEPPSQALDAVHGGIIVATVARAVKALDGCPDRCDPWEKIKKRKKERTKERKKRSVLYIYILIYIINN